MERSPPAQGFSFSPLPNRWRAFCVENVKASFSRTSAPSLLICSQALVESLTQYGKRGGIKGATTCPLRGEVKTGV